MVYYRFFYCLVPCCNGQTLDSWYGQSQPATNCVIWAKIDFPLSRWHFETSKQHVARFNARTKNEQDCLMNATVLFMSWKLCRQRLYLCQWASVTKGIEKWDRNLRNNEHAIKQNKCNISASWLKQIQQIPHAWSGTTIIAGLWQPKIIVNKRIAYSRPMSEDRNTLCRRPRPPAFCSYTGRVRLGIRFACSNSRFFVKYLCLND